MPRTPLVEPLEHRTLFSTPANITAALTAPAVTVPARADRYTFTVAYTGSPSVRAASLGNQDVIVTGPRNYRFRAAVLSTTPITDAGTVTATYSIVPPNHRWALTNNGTYTVTVLAHSIFNVNNDSNPANLTAGTFSVNTPNRPPSFKKGPNLSVPQSAGPQSFPGWATHIANTNPSSRAQTLTFLLTTSNDALFKVKPAISPTGTLTFTPAPGQTGTATITVRLKNSGGTTNNGHDTSAPQKFKITLTPGATA